MNFSWVMRISGIKGDSKFEKDGLNIESVSFGSRSGSSFQDRGSRESGKIQTRELFYTRIFDRFSSEIMTRCVDGIEIPLVTFTVMKEEDGKLIRLQEIKLFQALVSSFSVTGAHEAQQIESASLNFLKSEQTYLAKSSN